MAFSARRSLASSISRHLNRRLHPSLSHLLPSYHDRSEDPSCSSAPPPTTQQPSLLLSGDLRRRWRSQNLIIPLPFGAHLAAHRSFSSGPEVDAAAGVLSDAASSAVPAFPAPFHGEVAATAADSFLPVAAVQHLIDAVHSFTGLNWWASIALTMVLVRTATIPFLVHQLKAQIKFEAMMPEVKAINKDINSTDPRSRQERKKKLGELFRKHGVSQLTPYKLLFIQVPILLSFTYAIRNMIEKVPSLETGGAYWFTDLTTPDELYILPVLISIAYAAEEAHFCYWVPWTLFSLAHGFAFQQPAVRQFLDIPQVAPPRPAPAAPVPASEGSKPAPAVDSPPAANGSGQSSSEPMEKNVHVEKKRRTPRVIINREQ